MSKLDSQILVFRDFRFKDYPFNSREWSNQQLRFGVYVLSGYGLISTPKGRISIALYIKKRLEDLGWLWQAEKLGSWIHLYQRKYRDLEIQKDE